MYIIYKKKTYFLDTYMVYTDSRYNKYVCSNIIYVLIKFLILIEYINTEINIVTSICVYFLVGNFGKSTQAKFSRVAKFPRKNLGKKINFANEERIKCMFAYIEHVRRNRLPSARNHGNVLNEWQSRERTELANLGRTLTSRKCL